MINIVWGIIKTIFFLGILPTCVGIGSAGLCKRKDKDIFAFVYILGLVIMMALAEVLSVPLTLKKQSFMLFVWMYSVILGGITILTIATRRKAIVLIFKDLKFYIKNIQKSWIGLLALIYIPIIILAFHTTYIYGDDKTYITIVNDIISTNKLYLTDFVTGNEVSFIYAKYSLTSYWTWVAYLAKVTGIHPLILCKTVLVFIIIPAGYLVQGLLGSYLFHKDEKKVLVFMYFVILVTLFGGFSAYTVTYRFYTWVWQSKAFLAMIILPFLFYYCNYIFEENAFAGDYLILFLIILASCSSTLTGTGLAVGMAGILGFLYAIWNKKIGIFVRTMIACAPAFVFIFLYLNYNQFCAWINFNG